MRKGDGGHGVPMLRELGVGAVKNWKLAALLVAFALLMYLAVIYKMSE